MREKIQEILSKAKNPCVLVSFGKDSLVLLKTILDMGYSPDILWFRDHLNPFAEKIIREWDLTVKGYAPAVRYRVEDTVISEYAIGNARLPMLQDISEHGRPIGMVTTPQFSYPWDYTLFGYRKTDSHPLIGRNLESEITLGPTELIAPMYDLTDADVFNLIDELNIPYEPFCDDVLPCDLPRMPRETFKQRFDF
jgi:3'-phosphoadenosine 5'-phosphosulfate sulfotransferase (PAPS reductase)/FAD synthetase